ncbi:hypothetical protein N5P37_011832 [Trichoderma harzianum]|nr:hypothetical protein N5P37_011832 [Trichoderma harzianum]
MSPASEPPYYLVPNLCALDPSAPEFDLDAHTWVQATVIDDTDLTFGGKPLSSWFEEERHRLSSGSDSDSDSGNHGHGHHYLRGHTKARYHSS